MTTPITKELLTYETLSAWKAEALISLGETPKDIPEYSHHQAILTLVNELQVLRNAAKPELKPAHLINKFYERYPLATFKSDSARAEALGYFMAGAELQCFGEFIKYEDLYSDE